MRRRSRLWLLGAVVLFALAALLMLQGQGEEEAPPPPKVEFPRRMRSQERARMEKRRTYVPVVAPVDAGTMAVTPPSPPRDPVLDALPRGEGRTALVFEANALRYSPLGEMLLECLRQRGGDELERFRERTGVDPLQDVDRVVVTDDGLIVSGQFGKARLKEMMADRVSSDYGPGARIWEPQTPSEGRPRRQAAVGLWNDQMLVFGSAPDDVKQVIDRLDGHGEAGQPVLTEQQTYGEMYGVLGVEQLAEMFPPDQRDLAERLKEVAQNVELHLDASSDVAMVAQVRGENEGKVTDLGKSLGAALAVARMKAQAEGKQDLAQLLDFARVRPDGSSFRLEMAVPLDAIRDRIPWCRPPQESPQTAEGVPGAEER